MARKFCMSRYSLALSKGTSSEIWSRSTYAGADLLAGTELSSSRIRSWSPARLSRYSSNSSVRKKKLIVLFKIDVISGEVLTLVVGVDDEAAVGLFVDRQGGFISVLVGGELVVLLVLGV